VFVSENYLRVIPSDPWWQPAPEAAGAAAHLVEELLTSGGGTVDEVGVDHYDRETIIDAGVNTSSMVCSACRFVSDESFLMDFIERHPDGLDRLDVWVPCCGAVVPITSLRFDWPIGFARFEVSARGSSQSWLTVEQLQQVEKVLGHPVYQVLAHY
jgi:hypothetical protein